MVVDMKIVQLV